jgi:hypothetical protein
LVGGETGFVLVRQALSMATAVALAEKAKRTLYKVFLERVIRERSVTLDSLHLMKLQWRPREVEKLKGKLH